MHSPELVADPWEITLSDDTVIEPAPPSARRLPAWLWNPAASLLPLRVFIGTAWLRAWLEKAFDPAWYDGSAVRAFISEQLAREAPISGGYSWLMDTVLSPNAAVVGWLVMAAQLVAGMAILLGLAFRLGLAIGLALNANFIAAGAVSPSAFYLIMQAVLLGSGVGAVLSVESWWRTRRSRQPAGRGTTLFFVLAWVWAVVAIWALLNAHQFGGRAIEDPATVLAFDAALTAAALLLAAMPRLRAP